MTPRHRTVKAEDLKNGDLMRSGVSTNYVLVADASAVETGLIAVTLYNGDVRCDAPTFYLKPETEGSLSTFDAA